MINDQKAPKIIPKEKVKHHQPAKEEDLQNIRTKLPKEMLDRYNALKPKIDEFTKKVTTKFKEYIIGVSLLPPMPKKDANGQFIQNTDTNRNDLLIVIDDSDSLKMSKEELITKLSKIIDAIAKETDKSFHAETILMSEIWVSCFDGKDDLLKMISLSSPAYDKGLMSALKLTEIHKQMVLKKFERYIVAYVMSGTTIKGEIEPGSDIDVFLVIDDTDVKRMSRLELKDKLRAIITGMGFEASEITGVKGRINLQVYILTDFWDSLKEANPFTYSLLRDGVPLFDRGIFMPWKQLLRMGKIKPSPEAIDMFMGSGEHSLKRIRYKLREIGQDEVYYALITPSQAALMMYGIPPPAPKETPHLLREVFVKKEKSFAEDNVKILEKVIKVREDLLNGKIKEFSGTEADKLIKEAKKYLDEIRKLFSKLEGMKEKEGILQTYDSMIAVTRDTLKTEGFEDIKEEELTKIFEKELVHTNKLSEGNLRTLKLVMKAKKDYENDKLSKQDIEKVKKESRNYIKTLVEGIQRKQGRQLERAKIKVKHGDKIGEIIMLDKIAYIVDDVSSKKPTIKKANIDEKGALSKISDSNYEDLEKALSKLKMPLKVFIKEPIFEDLKKVFGKDIEIML